jgi:hypothetical protein
MGIVADSDWLGPGSHAEQADETERMACPWLLFVFFFFLVIHIISVPSRSNLPFCHRCVLKSGFASLGVDFPSAKVEIATHPLDQCHPQSRNVGSLLHFTSCGDAWWAYTNNFGAGSSGLLHVMKKATSGGGVIAMDWESWLFVAGA